MEKVIVIISGKFNYLLGLAIIQMFFLDFFSLLRGGFFIICHFYPCGNLVVKVGVRPASHSHNCPLPLYLWFGV